MDRPIFFLDFDGVICDSLNECFVSSWLAYTRGVGKEHSSICREEYGLFRGYRPYIRRGGDYVVLQHCISTGITLDTQNDFDRQEYMIGERGMDDYHARFYAARAELLESDRAYWLALNTIYPRIHDALYGAADEAWILTTKKVEFVHEILAAYGLHWNRERIVCSGKRPKADFIRELIACPSERAIFVDDQIDHFKDVSDERISCLLASWGYIVPDWLASGVDVIDEGGFSELLGRYFGPRT